MRALVVGVAAALVAACSGEVESDPSESPTVDGGKAADGGMLGTGGTCDPSLAVGAVSVFRQSFLDVIAFAEGTRDAGGNDGYNVLYAFRLITDCTQHPNQNYCSGGLCSTAAGRYQFLYKTWAGLNLPNFKPDNQAKAAMSLIIQRKATLPESRALTATEFSNVLDKISYEWASLPPGRYGQPVKTTAQLRTLYCSEVKCP